jgi:hypothetical protein
VSGALKPEFMEFHMELDYETLQALRTCAERASIENVLGLYCRAIDRLDVDLLCSVYHPDAIDDHGAMCLKAHEFAPLIVESLSKVCMYSMHTVTHTVIDVHGDRAISEAYYLGFHTIAGEEQAIVNFFGPAYLSAQRAAGLLNQPHEYVCGGRYLDVFEKRGGIWRILRRKITNEFSVCRPQSAVSEGVPAQFYTPGTRDRRDPVYGLKVV